MRNIEIKTSNLNPLAVNGISLRKHPFLWNQLYLMQIFFVFIRRNGDKVQKTETFRYAFHEN